MAGLRRRMLRQLRRLKPLVRPALLAPYVALSTRPPIIHSKDWAFSERPGPIWSLLDRLGEHEVHLLYRPSQYIGRPSRMEVILSRRSYLARRYPRVQFTVMADTEAVAESCAEEGFASLFCNNNALVDERIYRPLPGSPKLYDAVYDAKLAAFKRHHLAARVQSLALISYPPRTGVAPDYARIVRESLPHAHWFNAPLSPQFRWLDPWELNRALNLCRVGLCLSAREGTMWASVQYLLAGLPVVSTESEGGRDEFFHPDFVKIVPAEPVAVAEGVRDLITNGPDPFEIRRRTLVRMEEHRHRLFAFVNDILRSHGEARRFEDDWPLIFLNHLVDPTLEGRKARRRIDAYNQAIIEAVRQGQTLVAQEQRIRVDPDFAEPATGGAPGEP